MKKHRLHRVFHDTQIFKLLLLTTLFTITTIGWAQYTSSGYFVEEYTYRHDLNPAFANEKNYVSMPVLSNINVSLTGNLDLQNILYNVDGKTTTFLNPGVSTSEFLSNISDKNKIFSNIKIDILSAGFKGFGGYNTIGISARANVGVNIPGSLLRLAKQGPANQTYDISDFKAHADAYFELAFGHSHQINEQWRVGGKFKILLGAANVDADFDKASLTLGEDSWTAVTNAKVQASIKGLTYKTETKNRGAEGEKTAHTYVSDLDVDNTGINGFGIAVDFGAEFKPNDTWTFSASILDFGFIHWKNNMVASTNGEQTFDTDKYIFNVDEDASNSFENEFDRFTEGLSTLYELQDNGDEGGRTKMLGATLNLAAEYTLPAYDKLKFGLLNTTRIQGSYSWTDFRLSANVAPVKVFSAGINFGAGTCGCSFGWIANFHTTGYNFFIGMDRTYLKLSKQGVPLKSNLSLNLGMNFLF